MKNDKLTVLDFRKEQLVNLNEEDMMVVKGGNSSSPCIAVTLEIYRETKAITKDASWWQCVSPLREPPDENGFYITKHQYPEVTCASVPPLVIAVY